MGEGVHLSRRGGESPTWSGRRGWSFTWPGDGVRMGQVADFLKANYFLKVHNAHFIHSVALKFRPNFKYLIKSKRRTSLSHTNI